MKSTHITSLFASIVALVFAGCATTTDAPSTPPSATVTFDEKSVAYYGSATGGKGTLNYQGQTRRFTIAALGAGGMGAQKLSGTGKVYNLNSIADFSGTYRGVSTGFTVIEGTMHAKLTNDAGVVLYLAAETQGVATSTGLQSYQITLAN